MKSSRFTLTGLSIVLLATAAFAQEGGRPVALIVPSDVGERLVTTPAHGGLAISTAGAQVTNRELFAIENLNGTPDLNDGDKIHISYVPGKYDSIWSEDENGRVRRVPFKSKKDKASFVFTVKKDGDKFRLVAPSGKFVAPGVKGDAAFTTTDSADEALVFRAKWDPAVVPPATPAADQ